MDLAGKEENQPFEEDEDELIEDPKEGEGLDDHNEEDKVWGQPLEQENDYEQFWSGLVSEAKIFHVKKGVK